MTIDENDEISEREIISLVRDGSYVEILNTIKASDNFNINKGYDNGWTILHYAAELDNVELIRMVSRHPKVNLNLLTNDAASSPLIIAAEMGKYRALRCLLGIGADASILDSNGRSALMLAAKGNHLKCVDILLKTNTNLVKLQDRKGRNALMHGIENPKIVRKLIKISYLSQISGSGNTVLHYAIL